MPAKKPKIGRVHRHLRLQHRWYTGRLLHHRHTSYRGLALLLAVAGAFIIGLNIVAKETADAIVLNLSGGNSLQVYAKVPATIPSSGSTITQPVGGPIGKPAILVAGVCPHTDPHVIVAIYMDGVVQGSTACDDADTFNLPILVPPGYHQLVAKTFTITGDTAPDSDPVFIDFLQLNQPAPNTGSNKLPDTSPSSLTVTISEPFIVFGPGADAVWNGRISGGVTPYHVRINWGDGSTDDFTDTGSPSYRHHYKVMQSYDITITVRDSSGRVVVQHYAAVTPFRHPVTALGAGGSSPLSGGHALTIYIGYIILLIIFAIAWRFKHRQFAYANVTSRPRSFPVRYNNYYGARKRPNRRATKH